MPGHESSESCLGVSGDLDSAATAWRAPWLVLMSECQLKRCRCRAPWQTALHKAAAALERRCPPMTWLCCTAAASAAFRARHTHWQQACLCTAGWTACSPKQHCRHTHSGDASEEVWTRHTAQPLLQLLDLQAHADQVSLRRRSQGPCCRKRAVGKAT